MKNIIFSLLCIIISTQASATTYTVMNATDTGAGSLREAVSGATAGDTIRFATATNGIPITLTSGQILLSINLVIIGNDTTNTIIDGNAMSRIFEITAGDSIVIEGVKLQNGYTSENGGGIFNDGVLTLSNTGLINNRADKRGGGVHNDEDAVMYITYSTLKANNSDMEGGAIFNLGADTVAISNSYISNNQGLRAGGVYNFGFTNMSITDSYILQNSATNGPGGGLFIQQGKTELLNTELRGNEGSSGGGVYISSATFKAVNCLFSENHAIISAATTDRIGGGIHAAKNSNVHILRTQFFSNTAAEGGAITIKGDAIIEGCNIQGNTGNQAGGIYHYLFSGSSGDTSHLTVINTLISGNRAIANNGSGAGIWIREGKAQLINSTITGNRGANSGGIYLTGEMSISNTIVAKNYASRSTDFADIRPNSIAIIKDLGFNIIGDTSSVAGRFPLTTLKSGGPNIIDPLFVMDVPLNDSLGGELSLTSSSPGVDGGSSSLTTVTTDLDGNPRVVSCNVDIGAYEFQDLTQISNVVKNTNDAGCGSLRQIVLDATSGDTIYFSSFINGDTVLLTTGHINLDKTIVMIGNGPDNTFIDGNKNSRIFNLPSQKKATIESLTIQNGSAVGSTGGGINSQGQLTLTNVHVLKNHGGTGGGVYANFDTVVLDRVVLSGNVSQSFGGGYFSNSASHTEIKNTVVSGNKALFIPPNSSSFSVGGGIFHGGGTMNIVNCTITGNSTIHPGSLGGGLKSGNTTITNTIIAKNASDNVSGTSFTDGGNNLIGDNTGTFSAFNVSTLVGTASNKIDPLFIMDVPANDSTGGNFRLQCNSPAVNSGKADTTGLGIGAFDLGGQPRLIGTIDIGAYETEADEVNPIATCQDTTVFLNPIGIVAIDSSFINNGSSDNCSDLSMQLDNVSFDCDDIGEQLLTLTVTDASGNMNTCTSTVTIALPDSLSVNNSILTAHGETGTYVAGQLIESNSTVKATNSVTFQAGQEIKLLPEFTVEQMATFKAQIGVCGTN